jgi:membrane protein DedA with SNARE-associated domain
MSRPSRRAGRRAGHLLLLLYVTLCLCALTWPGGRLLAAWGAPSRLLGLPLWLVWHLGWLAASVAAMLLFHLTSRDADGPG